MQDQRHEEFIGILLAAGRGARFDPTGATNKLLQQLGNGDAVVTTAAKNLQAALPLVLAVVRPGADKVKAQLQEIGCEVTVCEQAGDGMGVSLVHALSQARDACGWLIALGDMPYVQPATMRTLLNAIRQGADIAVPTYQGRRGNPVAFGKKLLPELLQLHGDEGARRLLATHALTEIAVNDDGIYRDIDRIEDIVGK